MERHRYPTKTNPVMASKWGTNFLNSAQFDWISCQFSNCKYNWMNGMSSAFTRVLASVSRLALSFCHCEMHNCKLLPPFHINVLLLFNTNMCIKLEVEKAFIIQKPVPQNTGWSLETNKRKFPTPKASLWISSHWQRHLFLSAKKEATLLFKMFGPSSFCVQKLKTVDGSRLECPQQVK